ncbi:unnamed protein product [Calypogeia fissa]
MQEWRVQFPETLVNRAGFQLVVTKQEARGLKRGRSTDITRCVQVLQAEPVEPAVQAPQTELPRGVNPNVLVPSPTPVLPPQGDGVHPNMGALARPKAGIVDGAAKRRQPGHLQVWVSIRMLA